MMYCDKEIEIRRGERSEKLYKGMLKHSRRTMAAIKNGDEGSRVAAPHRALRANNERMSST